MSTLATYLSLVRFSHSVFALPFAFTGALLAWRSTAFRWEQVLWIACCMISARSAAMAFNRLVDARFDALNPRTAMREIPQGRISPANAAIQTRCFNASSTKKSVSTGKAETSVDSGQPPKGS